MPLTLPASCLHACEKFMHQLPSVLLPNCILSIPLKDHPPCHESACSFIIPILQVRFISKKKQGVGYKAAHLQCEMGFQRLMHPMQTRLCLMQLLCIYHRVVEKLVKKSGMCWKFWQGAERQPPDLLIRGSGRSSDGSSLVNLCPLVFMLASEIVVIFLIPWVKHWLSPCKTLLEMRKFSGVKWASSALSASLELTSPCSVL